jgi:hypothetical protein
VAQLLQDDQIFVRQSALEHDSILVSPELLGDLFIGVTTLENDTLLEMIHFQHDE